MVFIDNDSNDIKDKEPITPPDREIKSKKGSWINNITLAIVFFGLALYFMKDIGKREAKEAPPDNNEWSLPKEDKEDWTSHLLEPEIIIEKAKQETHEVERIADKSQRIERKSKENKAPVYEPFRMRRVNNSTNNDVRVNAVMESRASKPGGFDANQYLQTSMKSLAKANQTAHERTLNDRLKVDLLESTMAIQIRDLDRKILQGKLIPAVLDFSLHTDLPGKLRAYTSEPLFSQDGSRLLADTSSLLTGSYEGGMQFGVNHAFIIWERLVTTEGVVIELGSPAIGNLGRSGLGVDVDSHFWERFGSSIMLSVLNAGVSAAGAMATEGSAQTVQDIQANLNKSSEMALEQSLKIKPTGGLFHGSSFLVYVARDIEFPKSIFEGQ